MKDVEADLKADAKRWLELHAHLQRTNYLWPRPRSFWRRLGEALCFWRKEDERVLEAHVRLMMALATFEELAREAMNRREKLREALVSDRHICKWCLRPAARDGTICESCKREYTASRSF